MVTCKKCTKANGQLVCKTVATKYLHDRAFTTSSDQHPTFDHVKLSSSLDQSHSLDSSAGFVFPALQGGQRAELKGAIDWHTTISSHDRCIPAMKQWLYVGVGTDADEEGERVDLDLGIILYKSDNGKHKRHLLNWGNGEKLGVGRNPGRQWEQAAEYSGDNLTGAGEGDDEWMFLDLNLLKDIGVDVIAVMVHVYDGKRGRFQHLQGSFARYVMGDASGSTPSDQALSWSGAETVDYIDLDELRADKPPAALIGVLTLEAKNKLVLPKKTIEKSTSSVEKYPSDKGLQKSWQSPVGGQLEYPGGDGKHFNLAIKKYFSVCGVRNCDLADSVKDVEKNVLGMTRFSKEPKLKETRKEYRQKSLSTVDAAELEQENGAVFDPLDLLTPPITNNGPAYTPDLLSSNPEDALEAVVDQQTAAMTADQWLQELLVEFPGGPPGADTLCTKD